MAVNLSTYHDIAPSRCRKFFFHTQLVCEKLAMAAIGTNVWTDRALQDLSSGWTYGLASMYSASMWSFIAPGQHGY